MDPAGPAGPPCGSDGLDGLLDATPPRQPNRFRFGCFQLCLNGTAGGRRPGAGRCGTNPFRSRKRVAGVLGVLGIAAGGPGGRIGRIGRSAVTSCMMQAMQGPRGPKGEGPDSEPPGAAAWPSHGCRCSLLGRGESAHQCARGTFEEKWVDWATLRIRDGGPTACP